MPPPLHLGASAAISAALKDLLSQKHLYQSVEVGTKFVDSALSELRLEIVKKGPFLAKPLLAKVEALQREGEQLLGFRWMPGEAPTLNEVGFTLPTIHSFCASPCKQVWPFNPVPEKTWSDISGTPEHAVFVLAYECQSCKGTLIHFLVRRDGPKLTLCGRHPIEVYPTPRALPKDASKFYGDAHIAHHAGQTLAGLFLLRVFIEQFWRSVPEVKELLEKDPRATGEMLGEVYNSTLHDDFKSRFPSLLEAYRALSAAIHAADANAELFDQTAAKIVKHFEARRLYEL